jgi:peptidoglycan/LPS O-acetylase OafA/YrhL
MSQVQDAKKLDFVDALRGYAILTVIMVHVSQTDSLKLPQSMMNFFATGARGVQLFFVVSAFTLFYSFYNRLNKEEKPIRNFFIRRFFRIAPMYYLAIIYYVSRDGFNEGKHLYSILSNVFFIHGFTPYWMNSVVPGGWSIGVEMFFYLILPFLFMKVIKNMHHAIGFLLFSIFLKAILLYFFNQLDLIDDKIIQEDFYFLYFPSQLPFFAIGIILYFILIKKETVVSAMNSKLLIITGIIIVLYMALELNYYNNPDILFGIAFLLFAIGLSKARNVLFVNKIINYIGKISFSMYIVHFAVITFLTEVFYSFYFKYSILNFGFRYALVAVLTIVISSVCYWLIEVPFQKLGKKIIEKF